MYVYILYVYIYTYIHIPKLMCIGMNLKTGLANGKNYSIILGPGSKKEPEFPLSNFPLSGVSKASYLGSFQYSNSPRQNLNRDDVTHPIFLGPKVHMEGPGGHQRSLDDKVEPWNHGS